MTPAGLITGTRIVGFLGAGAASLVLGLTGAQVALTASTSILAGLVIFHLLLDRGWIRLAATTTSETRTTVTDGTTTTTTTEPRRDWGTAFKDGANLAITVEGVFWV
jgi:hypothetical protein